jgi:hypothetical protein
VRGGHRGYAAPPAAAGVPVTDTGGYYTSTQVEGALAELGARTDPMVGTPLGATFATGCCNQNRNVGIATQLATVSQLLQLQYFRVPVAFTAATITYYSGSTAAAATPTLVRYGLYSVAANGDITLIGSTANDTTLFSVASTRYPKALSVATALVPGQTYATAVLVVTGAAAPTLLSALGVTVTTTASSQAPRLMAQVAAQADLPAGVVAGSLANSASRHFAEITP